MTRDEIMELAVEKAASEVTPESLEWLFQPTNQFELLCRIDVDYMSSMVTKWLFDQSPDAMPHRFRPRYLAIMERAIQCERFYQRIKEKMSESSSR